MDESTANAQGAWLAQNDQTAQGAVDAGQAQGSLQDQGGAEYINEMPNVDYENGAIPTPPEGAPTAIDSASTPQDGVSDQIHTKDASVVHPTMDDGSTPPPPSYGSGGTEIEGAGTPTSVDTQMAVPSTTGSDGPAFESATPGQPGTEAQTASTGVPDTQIERPEPPLGLLPIIVFGFAAVAGLVVYLSRRGKNWSEISESMHSENGGGSQPESRMPTQFSEIQDMSDLSRTQASRQVSSFE
jgi:hypothetical protein